jgi:pullulanase
MRETKGTNAAQTVRILLIGWFICAPFTAAMEKEENMKPVDQAAVQESLDTFYSDKVLGVAWDDVRTYFRLFAPRATRVTLRMYLNADDETGDDYPLERDADGVWELVLDGHFFGRYYAYSIDGPAGDDEQFDSSKWVADPYSRAVATRNEFLHRGKSLIIDTSAYDWEGDSTMNYRWEDLMIYECHLRDMTAHPGAGVDPRMAGSYPAFIQSGTRGGINHIKSLGVNAVEFLPLQDFGNIELPYNEPVDGVTNTWNSYARNHWGYMTSYFFAPESYYADGQTLEPGKICGADGRQVNEFKDVVKALHREGIAVIMDVVYNHVSQYDQNCFKFIDKKYYFRLNPDDTYCSVSGCGNDFKTERPMARRLILDSVKFWMQEYHVDGFRFDLAAMIDWRTCDDILREAKRINPHAIIIAEPWGGGYAPAEFSQHGWAAWNDQFRNGIKGQNPVNGLGFIFGQWFDRNNLSAVKRYIQGTLVKDGGLFAEKAHSINYLESHDDFTLGDFIRLGLGGSDKVDDIDANAVLTPEQLKLNKLAALILFTSQGAAMLHEGQEWARSKVIAACDAPDENVGAIDHNSYNKDNETNWLNFAHADLNQGLVQYYKGLIALRKAHLAFRKSGAEDIEFLRVKHNPFALGYLIHRTGSGDDHDFIVLLNGHRTKTAKFKLPKGQWTIIVDGEKADLALPLGTRRLQLPPSSGMVLQR